MSQFQIFWDSIRVYCKLDFQKIFSACGVDWTYENLYNNRVIIVWSWSRMDRLIIMVIVLSKYDSTVVTLVMCKMEEMLFKRRSLDRNHCSGCSHLGWGHCSRR